MMRGRNMYVYAKPRSRDNRIESCLIEQDKITVQLRIMALPKDSKANEAIIMLLAKTLDISKSTIQLIRRATSRHKIFKIEPWSDALTKKLYPYQPLPTLFDKH